VEVLALELTGKERFCVFVDHAQGVDHALCVRVTEALRDYLDEYSVEVSSPGFERPLRTKQHFERAVGQAVRVKTETGRARGEVVSAGEKTVQIRNDNGSTEHTPVEISYDEIVRANLIDEGTKG
jgi:ribosome maturation factor RimP